MTTLGEMTIEDAAREAAGNWRKFVCFAWDRGRDLDDCDQWAILYTHNRDSGLLDQSNASAIAKALEPFTEGDDPDVVFESHSHWAVGHVDGFSIRVYGDGEIADAFRVYHDLAGRVAAYPILDETDYYLREYEATIQNIGEAASRIKRDYDLPDQWDMDAYAWLADLRPGSVESRDDRGGYPSEDHLRAAFEALGYERLE
ncbi:MAG: hypothetical protein BGO49_20340 [Planctomycetales bacterium 71-10]|nr:MAG: hypothetical protein BGO49_20340 [Planctomycetales bacterium 71-10]